MPGQCYYQHYFKKGGVITLDKIRQVGLNIQDNKMLKEEKTKVEGGAKLKGRRFQLSTSTQKASLKAPTHRL